MFGRNRFSILIASALLAPVLASARPESAPVQIRPASEIQTLIDGARSGDVIRIPEGVYRGAIHINKSIQLVGAGSRKTILDGTGQAIALLITSKASVSQVAVRGANIGIEIRAAEALVQDSLIARNQSFGIHCLADAILFNNRILENGSGVGVNSRNPILLHNTISRNAQIGVWSWYAPGPTLIHNLVTENRLAMDVGAGSHPEYIDNAEWGNSVAVAEFSNVESVQRSDLLKAKSGKDAEGDFPVGALGARRGDVELDRSAAEAYLKRFLPTVTYRLTPQPGVFQLELAFSSLPFQTGTSPNTTGLKVLKAWDTKGTVQVFADAKQGGTWEVKVDSLSADVPTEARRYKVLCEVTDAASWRQDGDKMIFERVTSIGKPHIVPPTGWTVRALHAGKSELGTRYTARVEPAQP